MKINSFFQALKEAKNKETPPPRLLEIVHHKEAALHTALSSNPSTPAEALWLLLEKDVKDYSLREIAAHPNANAETLQRLADSELLRVQAAVAQNPNTPEQTLHALSARGIELQRALANNPLLPHALIIQLSQQRDDHIEAALAKNPNTPPALALRFGQRFPSELLKNPALELILLERPETIAEMPAQLASSILYIQTPPAWIWEAAASHAEPLVREQAAKHSMAPSWLLQKLLGDENARVKKAAQRNPRSVAP